MPIPDHPELVAFSGSRHGMTQFQQDQLRHWLKGHKNRIVIMVHGCCQGADIQAHQIFREICGRGLIIEVLPSTASTKAPVPEDADVVQEPDHPLKRNKVIVERGKDLLIAAPGQDYEIRRSGTWAAIRWARKIGVPVMQLPRSGAKLGLLDPT